MENKTKAYSCKIFTVWEEDIQLANGRKTRQNWIDHQPTVAVMAINDKNELLLISQYRVPTGDQLLEIPAGSFDDGESPAECAQRELAEETGFRSGRLTELYAGYLLPGYCNEYMHFFLAEDLVYEPLSPDDDEDIEVMPTPLNQVFEMLQNGRIRDAKTALGVLLVERYLSNKLFYHKVP